MSPIFSQLLISGGDAEDIKTLEACEDGERLKG
jgi:hypothetical protein